MSPLNGAGPQKRDLLDLRDTGLQVTVRRGPLLEITEPLDPIVRIADDPEAKDGARHSRAYAELTSSSDQLGICETAGRD